MRRGWTPHIPTLAVFVVMLLIVGGLGLAADPVAPRRTAITVFPLDPIPLPAPGMDADGDGYADDLDLWAGDAMVRVEVTRLETGLSSARPYLVVGTQDDHWRFGAGRALEWLHVVDPDPLDPRPGSPDWQERVLRTGTWQYSIAGDGQARALTHATALGPDDAPEGTSWPHVFLLNVRDDAATVTLRIELWDERRGPDPLLGAWEVDVHAQGAWQASTGTVPTGQAGMLREGDASLEVSIEWVMDLDPATKRLIAERWAPTLHFTADEAFFPTTGEVLQEFHGFASRVPDHQTWSRSFNNGRDTYRLLVADFDGNGVVDHRDVRILTDVLRAGGRAPDTVYAHVTRATGDSIIVQYWFFYMYNYVLDEQARDIAMLAHAGDREFIQLGFRDLQAALAGTPDHIAYSQHYQGIRIDAPALDEPPFGTGTTPTVYVARGSHASYPVPGDDSRTRRAFVAYEDLFLGDGETWQPADYGLEVLGAQEWHLGFKWGPATRHSRELGSAGQPLLQHSFTYPFHDPWTWAGSLHAVTAADVHDLYRTPEALR